MTLPLNSFNTYKQKHIKTPFLNLLLPIKALHQQLYPMFFNWIPHSPYEPKVGPFDLKVGLPELQISLPEPQTSQFESKLLHHTIKLTHLSLQ